MIAEKAQLFQSKRELMLAGAAIQYLVDEDAFQLEEYFKMCKETMKSQSFRFKASCSK